jgi:hypothetical protein
MSLVAGCGLDERVIADCAHFKFLDGVLPDPGVVGAVDALQLLAFAVGEDGGRSAVLGVLAHCYYKSQNIKLN